ncbi:MAG: fibronectin type III domain-containing protein, partial [FCB group bacterium]|nr:fibronectin type III domain-containing protein [FCB group bacterium]
MVISLAPASLLIGAGIAHGATYPGQTLVPVSDLTGEVRPNPAGSTPDLGAYESSFATTPYPSAPTGLTATAGDGQVTLNWTANSESDIAKYGIYYGTATAPNTRQAEATGVSTTTYTVNGLNNNETYYFRITAIDNDAYESGFSNEVSATPQYSGTDIYVDVDSVNAGYTADGSAAKPFGSIQEAINAVSDGVRILVKPGTYTGTGSSPVVDLKGKQIVLESVDGPDTTIIDAGGSFGNRIALKLDAQDGFFNGYDNSTQLIGFTFTNGDDEDILISIVGPDYGSGSTLPWNPKFVNCRFTNTSKTSGSNILPVIHIQEAAPVFDRCEFRGLSMVPSSNISIPGELKAPIVLEGSYISPDPTIYSPQFLNCVIAGNSNSLPSGVTNTGIHFKGGALYIGFGMAPVFENTRIDSNTVDANSGPTNFNWSRSAGGAVYISDYYNDTPTPIQFNNCSISHNTVKGMEAMGGGIYSLHPYLQITNCLIVDNSVYSIYDPNNQNPGSGGGGIGVEINPSGWGNYPGSGPTYGPTVDLINVTIAGNQLTPVPNGPWGGAGVGRSSTMHFTIFNTIIAENDVVGFNDPARENMSTDNNAFGSGSADIGYALITNATDAGISGDYLFDTDPAFTGNGDYSLSIASKAIGKGGTTYGNLSAPTTDYYGNSRPTTSYDPGSGTYGPDLGAIENSLTVSPYPNAPENLMVTDENDSTVTLSWTAPGDNDLAIYRIYYDTFSPAGSLLDSVAGVTTRIVHGLTNGTTYYFRVTAVDLDGYESDFSNEVSGTPSYKGPVWYVDDAAGTFGNLHDGSPANPFGDIGDVFSNAPMNPGDTILVLPGTYNDSDDRNLYDPGFAFVLMSRDGPDSTIIELKSGTTAKYQFFTFNQEADTSTKIIGFTIQNGGGYEYGTGTNGYNYGGAMRFESAYDWGLGQFPEVSPV